MLSITVQALILSCHRSYGASVTQNLLSGMKVFRVFPSPRMDERISKLRSIMKWVSRVPSGEAADYMRFVSAARQ